MQNNVVKIIHQKFEAEYGFKLPNNPDINKRIQQVSYEIVQKLSTTSGVKVNIPFLYADSSGPKHLEFDLTREQVENFDLFSHEKIIGKNASSSFINNVHNRNSKESDPDNYLKSVMQQRENEKKSEKKSNSLFFLIIVLILGVLLFAAIQIFNIF